jgi:hypothetical protein
VPPKPAEKPTKPTEKEPLKEQTPKPSDGIYSGKDLHPVLRHLHEEDIFIYSMTLDAYLEKYKLEYDYNEPLRVLNHMEKHVDEFRAMFERMQFNEDFKNKTDDERKEILDIAKSVHFHYLDDIGRFKLKLRDPFISNVILSPQLCYTLGYETGQTIRDGQVAKFSVDMHGGVSHLCVYLNNGLIVSLYLNHCTIYNLGKHDYRRHFCKSSSSDCSRRKYGTNY